MICIENAKVVLPDGILFYGVVLVENGGGGNAVAGTVAGKVLDVIVNGYQ